MSTETLSSFEQRLDAAPITRSMWRLWGLAAGLIALDGFDFFIIGVAMPFLQRDFNLGAPAIGAVAAAALVGALVGSLTLGPLTDRIGRQRMLVVDVAIFVVATAGTVLAWNAASLIAFRFLVGVGIGADYPISVAYITENVPARQRGRLVIGAFAFQAVGALIGALTGLAAIALCRARASDLLAIQFAWRGMLAVGLGLAIAVAILRLSFPLESPHYHLARGEYAAASAAASQLLGEPIAIAPPPAASTTTEPAARPSLFAPDYRRPLALAALPWFLQDIATYGLGIFTPTIIGTLAFARESDFLAREMAAARGAAWVDLFLIAGFGLAVLLVERLGRIRLQIAGFLGMALGLAILAYADTLPTGTPLAVGWVFVGFFTFNLLMNAGPNATTFLLAGEVFPTAIRASGAGLAAAIAKAGAILGTFTLPSLETAWGTSNLLLALAASCLLAAALTYACRIETAGSKLATALAPTSTRQTFARR